MTNPATPVEALRGIRNRADGCIEANKLHQYRGYRENRAEGIKLSVKVKAAQTLCNIEEEARAALPAAEREEEVKAMLVDFVRSVVETMPIGSRIETRARSVLKAATGGAE